MVGLGGPGANLGGDGSAGEWTGPSGPPIADALALESGMKDLPEHLNIALATWQAGLIESWFNDLAARKTLITAGQARNGLEQLKKAGMDILRLYHPDKLVCYYALDEQDKKCFGRDVMDKTEAVVKGVVSQNRYLNTKLPMPINPGASTMSPPSPIPSQLLQDMQKQTQNKAPVTPTGLLPHPDREVHCRRKRRQPHVI